jgi:aldehyde dehydrogenase (NAD+)
MTPTNQQTSSTLLCEAAQRFLARDEHRLLINGEGVAAVSSKTFDTFDPSTGVVLGRLAEGDEADVDRAVRAARAAFEGSWSRWTPYERQTLLYRAHDAIDRNFEELAQIETMDMGAPISRTRATCSSPLNVAESLARRCPMGYRATSLPCPSRLRLAS